MFTSIEQKIETFKNSFDEEFTKEKEESLKNLKEIKDKRIAKTEFEVKQFVEDSLKDTEKKAMRKKQEAVYKEVSATRSMLVDIEEEYINKILEDVKKNVNMFTDTKDYEDIIFSAIKEYIQKNNTTSISVILNNKDYSKFKNRIEEEISKEIKVVKSNIEFIGGIIFEDNERKFKIDNTIDRRFYDIKEFIGSKVVELVNKES